ncbi:MAG: alcohol dehydrogenase catalytic domain-containing protein, partial [Clostridiales bacterium]|nr:alcohol dehydrogenase catalytic domain-containing protein [Clostridiales bacterium]
MKYAVIPQAGVVKIEEKPIPPVEEDRVLIKIKMCGICGTDTLIHRGVIHVNYPYSPGHEYSGVVEAVGGKVNGIKIGDRVVVNPNHACGLCYYCRRGLPNHCENLKMPGIKSNGGFAEYVSVPEKIVYRIPGSISFEQATLIEPVSCVLHMIDEADIRMGDLVVIIGGGTMGLISLQLCRHYGARIIVLSEPAEYKRELAKQLGADIVCDPIKENLSSLIKELDGHGADVVLDNVGSSGAIFEGYKCLRKKGRLIISGLNSEKTEIPVPSQDIVKNELAVKGVFLNPDTFSRTLSLMESRVFPWGLLLTHEFPLCEIDKAFAVASEGQAIKVQGFLRKNF